MSPIHPYILKVEYAPYGNDSIKMVITIDENGTGVVKTVILTYNKIYSIKHRAIDGKPTTKTGRIMEIDINVCEELMSITLDTSNDFYASQETIIISKIIYVEEIGVTP